MSVLKTKDNKEMIISCGCGCENSIYFKIDNKDKYDLYCIMTYLNGDQYKVQNDTVVRSFIRKMKKIISIIRNKDYVYSELTLSKKDFEEFKEYVNQF